MNVANRRLIYSIRAPRKPQHTRSRSRALNEWADSQKYNNIPAGRYTEMGMVKTPLCLNPNCAQPVHPNVMFCGECGTPLRPH